MNQCNPIHTRSTDNLNDCQVLYLGDSHDTYRGVNETLAPLGLNVMWARDIDSAQMLAQTTNMELLLCDSKINHGAKTLFDAKVIQPGVSCLEMSFSSSDLRRTKKLRTLVTNLISPNTTKPSAWSSSETRVMR